MSTPPRHLAKFLLAACCLTALAPAQSPSFEVATIKPADPDARGRFIRIPSQDRLSVSNMTLFDLIRFAYGEGLGASLEITGGPNWVNKDRFDIEAKAEKPVPASQLRLMVRALLAERFALKTHTEKKEVNVYAMTVARNDGKLGPKVQPWDGKCNGREPPAREVTPKTPVCGAFFRPPGMALEGVTMEVIADMLSTPIVSLGRPVVDRTGLAGRYTMELDYQFRPPGPGGAAPATDDPLAPSVFTAIQEQLGLKLQSAKGDMDVLVIDQASRPTDN